MVVVVGLFNSMAGFAYADGAGLMLWVDKNA